MVAFVLSALAPSPSDNDNEMTTTTSPSPPPFPQRAKAITQRIVSFKAIFLIDDSASDDDDSTTGRDVVAMSRVTLTFNPHFHPLVATRRHDPPRPLPLLDDSTTGKAFLEPAVAKSDVLDYYDGAYFNRRRSTTPFSVRCA